MSAYEVNHLSCNRYIELATSSATIGPTCLADAEERRGLMGNIKEKVRIKGQDMAKLTESEIPDVNHMNEAI